MSIADLDFVDHSMTDGAAWIKIMKERELAIRNDERQKILDKIDAEQKNSGLGFVPYQTLRWIINERQV